MKPRVASPESRVLDRPWVIGAGSTNHLPRGRSLASIDVSGSPKRPMNINFEVLWQAGPDGLAPEPLPLPKDCPRLATRDSRRLRALRGASR